MCLKQNRKNNLQVRNVRARCQSESMSTVWESYLCATQREAASTGTQAASTSLQQIWHPAPTGWHAGVTAPPLLCIARGHLPKTASLHCLANLLSCSPTHSKAVCTAKARGGVGICMWGASAVDSHYGWYPFSLIPTSSHIYIYSLGRRSAPRSLPYEMSQLELAWCRALTVCNKKQTRGYRCPLSSSGIGSALKEMYLSEGGSKVDVKRKTERERDDEREESAKDKSRMCFFTWLIFKASG